MGGVEGSPAEGAAISITAAGIGACARERPPERPRRCTPSPSQARRVETPWASSILMPSRVGSVT